MNFAPNAQLGRLSIQSILADLMIRISTPTSSDFACVVAKGLSRSRKSIPSKFLYDEPGSHLFDRICETEDYYVTRVETSIMQGHVGEMAELVGEQATLVELGSGSSQKTRWLLREISRLESYMPLDISDEFLQRSVETLRREYPQVNIQPYAADFTADLPGLQIPGQDPIVFYCPGSTIGNLSNSQSLRLLSQMAAFRNPEADGSCGSRRCGLLIGIDLQKDPTVIEAAYNDREGVTAAFSKNLLTRMNRELDAEFDPDRFEHHAIYDRAAHQVNIGLRSLGHQRVNVAGRTYSFRSGELIHTEVSRKYRIADFSRLARGAGFHLLGRWTDSRRYFAVLYFETQTEDRI